MAGMDTAEAASSLGQAHRSPRARGSRPLDGWVPPLCAVMFGAAVALQGPSDTGLGLMYPLIGLALAIGAWALIASNRARRGIRRPRSRAWIPVVAVVGAGVLSASSPDGTSGLGRLYVLLGVAVAGVVWFRLRREAGTDRS